MPLKGLSLPLCDYNMIANTLLWHAKQMGGVPEDEKRECRKSEAAYENLRASSTVLAKDFLPGTREVLWVHVLVGDDTLQAMLACGRWAAMAAEAGYVADYSDLLLALSEEGEEV